jgi:ketosteroid isomerase-like protein
MNDQETIRELEQQRYRAMRDSDVDALDTLCDDALVYLHSNTSSDTKSSLLAKLRDDQLRCTDVQHLPDEDVLISGDTAVASGQVTGTVYVNGAAVELCNRALAVWNRRFGRWRLLAYQSTPIPAG